MPLFRIEQYEIHYQRYNVHARMPAGAIAKLLAGNADAVNLPEYFEVCQDRGLPVDQNKALAEELRQAGIAIGEDIIPSIRNIEEID